MHSYELTVILRINENLTATRENVEKSLQKHGAVVKSVNEWGRRKMAYAIDRTEDGFYLIYTIDAAPDAVKNITADYRLIADILRFLFVRLEEVKTA
jgi:small subunit ribosomal protein S6